MPLDPPFILKLTLSTSQIPRRDLIFIPILCPLQKNYTSDWDEDKTMFFPYTDSPELQRVAKAQEALSDVRETVPQSFLQAQIISDLAGCTKRL